VLSNRCRAIATIILLVIASCNGGEVKKESPIDSLSKRNIVLIVADALPAKMMSCYGEKCLTTPNLDDIASKGVRFTYAYSQTSWTVSSVASIFTGLEQENHRLLSDNELLNDKLSTLAELFKAKGYKTVSLFQNEIIGAHTGLNKGFDTYQCYNWNPHGMRTTFKAAEQILTTDHGQPVFLYLHLLPPHEPFSPPAKFRNRFDPDYKGDVDGGIQSMIRLRKEKKDPTHKDVIHLVSLAKEHLNWIDWEIGKFMKSLQEKGKAEESLFIITSDHGQAFMEHGRMGHNTQVFEEMVRIPMIFYAPGGPLKAGEVIDEPVILTDLLPTFAEMFGLNSQDCSMDGVSLVPLLDSSHFIRSKPLLFSSRYSQNNQGIHTAIRAGDHKLIMFHGQRKPVLFDIKSDPHETADISKMQPEITKRLKSLLKNWQSEAEKNKGGIGDSKKTKLSDETKNRIKAIGY